MKPAAKPTASKPVARPTRRPTTRPTRAQASRTESAGSIQARTVGTCGGGITGNGICVDASLCCSEWGWCGSTSDYCGNKAPLAAPVAPVAPVQVTPYPTYAPAPVGDANCGSESNVMNVNFGYYQSWAIWRQQGCNKVVPNAINVAGNKYTHVAYAFAGINATDYLAPWGDDYQGEVPQYALFNSLKTTYPSLKTSIAVGGWTFNNPGATASYFSDIAASASRRATFASSVISFLETVSNDVFSLF